MLLDIPGAECPPTWFGNLTPTEVLLEYEGPRSWLAVDPEGAVVYVHQVAESEAADPPWRQQVLVAYPGARWDDLRAGRLPLRELLVGSGRVGLVDRDAEGRPIRARVVRSADIPDSHLPLAGVGLGAENGGATC